MTANSRWIGLKKLYQPQVYNTSNKVFLISGEINPFLCHWYMLRTSGDVSSMNIVDLVNSEKCQIFALHVCAYASRYPVTIMN